MPDSSKLPDMENLHAKIIDIIKKRLPDKKRLVMFYILEGLTLEEISKLIDNRLSTVFIIKRRAISKLKDFLGLG